MKEQRFQHLPMSPQDLKNQAAVKEGAVCHCSGGALASRNPLFHGRGAGEEEDTTRSRWYWALWQVGGLHQTWDPLGGMAFSTFLSSGAVPWFSDFAVNRQHVDGEVTVSPQTLAGQP